MAETKSTGTKSVPSLTDDQTDRIVSSLLNITNGEVKASNGWKIIFSIIVGAFTVVTTLMVVFFISTMNDMHATYIQKTEEIIIGKENIEMTNSWERLPAQQQKEQLRSQYYKIVRYYTENINDEQKMNDELILDSFNTLFKTTERVNQNFFLPLAYMKVATNFNPVYNSEYKRGIGGFYLRTYEQIANLPIVREDAVFQTPYKGSETVNNPNEAIKLIVARMDDLMATFNNRIDWVLLSMFTNEYDVIEKYWDGGDGAIPDDFYEKGQLAEALRYYHAFSNWKIPRTVTLE
jgi:hypothetical protein